METKKQLFKKIDLFIIKLIDNMIQNENDESEKNSLIQNEVLFYNEYFSQIIKNDSKELKNYIWKHQRKFYKEFKTIQKEVLKCA